MRALMFRGPMDLTWEEVETPQIIEPRDALVRPIAVARCDLDPVIAMGLYPLPADFIAPVLRSQSHKSLGFSLSIHGDERIVDLTQ